MAEKVLVTESYLEDIADAIRAKTGGSDTYKPGEMAEAIRGIEDSGAVRYDEAQTLTDAQKQQARDNIGVGSGGGTGAVRYDEAQSLTDAQKTTARGNIAAASAGDVGALSAAMTYVVNGNKSIESVTIPVGAYVRLVGSTIAGRSDGIYTVATEIPVNTVIDGTYFNESAPIQGGGLNAIQQSLANVPFMMSNSNTWTTLNYSIENRNGILMTTPVDGFYAFGLRGTGNGGVTTRIALKSDYSDWFMGSQVQAMVNQCVYLRAGTTVYARMENGGRIDCYGYYT